MGPKNYILFCFLGLHFLYSQEIGCSPDIKELGQTLGADEYLCQFGECLDLSIDISSVKTTDTYDVSSITFSPPVPFGNPLANSVYVPTDDIWSPVVDFKGPRDVNNDGVIDETEQNTPYNFCFFGNTYNKVIIGSNGVISFRTSASGQKNEWQIPNGATLPSRTTGDWNDANIFGACHDIDFGINNSPNYLTWEIFGEYPCRYLVVLYDDVPQYQCNNLKTSQMMVLYENTNIIEVYIKYKPRCLTWNPDTPANTGGNAVIGIQNDAGTIAYTPPNRNNFKSQLYNEAWRFSPSGAYTPEVKWFSKKTGQNREQIGTGVTQSVCIEEETEISTEVTYNTCSTEFTVSDSVFFSLLDINLPATTPISCDEEIPVQISVNNYSNANYQWYFNNTPISGANSNSVSAPEVGVYRVEVQYSSGSRSCNKTATTTTVLPAPPTVNDATALACDNDFDGNFDADLMLYVSNIVNNPVNFTFTFHSTLNDAENNLSPLSNIENYNLGPTLPVTLFVRVEDNNTHCSNVAALTLISSSSLTLGSANDLYECEYEVHSDQAFFDLTTNENSVFSDPNASFTYYTSEQNAKNRTNAISNPSQFQNSITPQTIWIRATLEDFCDNYTSFNVVVNPLPFSFTLQDQTICPSNEKAYLDAGSNFNTYQWYFEGEEINGENQSFYETNVPGNYSVLLTSSNEKGEDCSYEQTVHVYLTDIPRIVNVEYGNGYIELTGEGEGSPYLFNVNGGEYLTLNRFYLPPGVYDFGIKNSLGCEGDSVNLPVISLSNIFTPNGDGVNDLWTIHGVKNLNSPQLKIFDRYGKSIVNLSLDNNSDFQWDGTYLGRKLPSSTYWYELNFNTLSDKKIILSGYVVIKNRRSNE